MKVIPKQWIVAPGTSLRMMALALLVWGGGISAQTIPAYVPKDSLVGWWPFNGNANDESGNGNNGTVNGATLTSDRNGKANSAYSFDGVDDFISVASINSINGNNSRTMGIWVQLTQGQNGGSCLSQGPEYQSGCNRGFHINATGPNADCGYSGCGVITNCSQVRYPYVFNDGIWHYLVVTYSTSGYAGLSFYVDGNLISSTPSNCRQGTQYTSFNTDSLFGISFGKRNDNYYFKGQLDDIGIWNRALTQQEITDLYDSVNCKNITGQPQTINTKVNTQGRFVCQSNDSSATYQWQTDLGVGFQNLNNVGQYSGANTDTLLVSNVSTNNDKQPFRCIVSSGNCKDTSSEAVLNIQNCLNGFQSQPANQNIPVGSNASWIATANDSNATYQWQTDLGVGFQNLNSVGQYSGTKNDTLIVSNVTMGNHNQPFRCLISAGTCKDTSSVAVLTVNNPAGIKELVRATDFIIYPNPASTVVTIDFGNYGSMTGYSLRIVNAAGQTIYTTSVNQPSVQINLNAIAGKGLYFVQIINPQQKTVENRKLVIQ